MLPEGAYGKTVHVLTVHDEITDITLRSLKRRVAAAIEEQTDLIVLDLNTPGGLVTSALEICTYLKTLEVPTLAWVHHDAYSAGAMISVACDGIIVADPASIGDCAPIMIGPTGLEPMGATERAKIESPILNEFLDSAQRNGYSPVLSEVMVRLGPAVYQIENTDTRQRRHVYEPDLAAYFDPDGSPLRPTTASYEPPRTEAPLLIPESTRPVPEQPNPIEEFGRRLIGDRSERDPSAAPAAPPATPPSQSVGQLARQEGVWRVNRLANPANTLLTMNHDRAIDFGFAQQVVRDDEALARFTDAADGRLFRLDQTWSESLADWLTSPAIRGVLFLIFLVAGYMELQSPGIGLPAAVSLSALAVLLIAPYLAGLASVFDITLILVGIILIGVEIFVLPGFGVAGIAGIALVLGGMILTFIESPPGPGFWPSTPGTWESLRTGVISLVAALTLATAAMVLISRYFGSIPVLSGLILQNAVRQGGQGSGGAATAGGGAAADAATGVAVGSVGRVITSLRPVGRADFDGELVDVMTQGEWIEPDRQVKVVEVSGNRVVVERA